MVARGHRPLTRSPRLASLLAFGGIGFLVAGILIGWGDIVESFRWSPGAFSLAIAANTVGLISVAGAWAVMHRDGQRLKALRRFLLIQPAKHLPGGVAQPIGLMSASARDLTWVGSVATFVRFSLVLLAGGLFLGVALLADERTGLFGMASVLVSGLIVAGLAHPRSARLIDRLLQRMSWLVARSRPDEAAQLPTQSLTSLVAAFALSILGVACLAFGFTLVARFGGLSVSARVLAGSFGLAWSLGYAAFPIPAGLGVRESALLFMLPNGRALAGPILAASVLHRLSQVLAELLTLALAAGTSASRNRQRPAEDQEA